MARVRKEAHGVGYESERTFDNHICEIQGDAEFEGAVQMTVLVGGQRRVVMMVSMGMIAMPVAMIKAMVVMMIIMVVRYVC